MTCSSLLFAASMLLGNILLLTPAGSPLRVAGGLVVLLLPGLVWARWLFPTTSPLVRWIVGAGLSFALAMTAGLVLSYLPGSISLWAELAVLDGLTVIPLLGIGDWRLGIRDWKLEVGSWSLAAKYWLLALILLVGAFF